MANHYKLTCDKTEINAVYSNPKGDLARISLTYDKIVSISFDKCEERKLFKKLPSEKITLRVRGLGEPIEYYKLREGEYFESYKRDFEKFARDNRITFYNNLDKEQDDI